MRWLFAVSYVGFILREVVRGSCRIAALTLSRECVAEPAIIELPTKARSDLEIMLLASSITITPGTLVLGVAAAQDDQPPSLFVHSMFDRTNALAGLRDLETRLLRAMRKEER